jgi:hypothetical protein
MPAVIAHSVVDSPDGLQFDFCNSPSTVCRPEHGLILAIPLFGSLHRYPLVNFVEVSIERFGPGPSGRPSLSRKLREDRAHVLEGRVKDV